MTRKSVRMALSASLCFLVISTPSAIALDIQTRTGKTYRNARIQNVTPSGIQIAHAGNTVNIDFRDLPQDIQDYFEYDPKARRSPQQAGQEAYDKWFRRLTAQKQHEERERRAQTRQAAKVAEEKRQRGVQKPQGEPPRDPRGLGATQSAQQPARTGLASASSDLPRARGGNLAPAVSKVPSPSPSVNSRLQNYLPAGMKTGLALLFSGAFLIVVIAAIRSALAIVSRKKANNPTRPSAEDAGSADTNNSRGQSENTNNTYRPSAFPLSKDEKYYGKVLGLTGKLTKADLKRCYREMAAKYHPDKVQHLGKEFQDLAEEKARQINEAYDFFRERYDL